MTYDLGGGSSPFGDLMGSESLQRSRQAYVQAHQQGGGGTPLVDEYSYNDLTILSSVEHSPKSVGLKIHQATWK